MTFGTLSKIILDTFQVEVAIQFMAICDIYGEVENSRDRYEPVKHGYSPNLLVVCVQSSVTRGVIFSICGRVERTPDEVE